MTKLYVAYGSNLCKSQMRRRCLSAKPLGRFILKDARLVFRVYADVEYCPGAEVPCGLWSINQADERVLDQYEGTTHPNGYFKEYLLLKYAGRPRKALIYLMRSADGIAPPSKGYYETVFQGYEDFGLDRKYLDEALQHAWDEKAHSQQTRARRERQRSRTAVVHMPESLVMRRLRQENRSTQ